MKYRIRQAALRLAFLCAAAAILSMVGQIGATAAEKLSRSVSPQIATAQKDLQAKDFPGAAAALKEALAVSDRKPFDNFVIYLLSAQAEQGLNDQKAAAADIEAAADSQGVPDDQKKLTLHNALISSAVLQHWSKTVAYGQQLAQMNGLDAETAGNLAIAYYDMNDFPHAQQYAQQSIAISKAAGQQPDPNALQIVMSSQLKQNNQAGVAQTLEQIALQNNSPGAWAQLVGVTFATPGMSNAQALYLFRLLEAVGAMTAEDYKEAASDASVLGYPTEAVHVIEQGISSGKLSSGSVAAILPKARRDAATDERSLPQIAAAAEKSRSGEQDVKLGEDYWGYGRYADAEAAARRAVSKGGLKTPWEAPLLIGAAEVVQGKYADAIQSLSQVSGNEAAAKTAHLWSLYAQAKQGPARAAAPAAPTPPRPQ